MASKVHFRPPPTLVLGVGSFAQSAAQILKDDGARVFVYLTRNAGHFAPSLAAPVFPWRKLASPAPLVVSKKIGLLVPQSIDWARMPWANALLKTGAAMFSPTGEAMRLERERDFARALCARFGIPFAKSHFARNRAAAEAIVRRDRRGYVIKNPLCAPNSPIHTIVCETPEETLAWLGKINDAEGVFLQEYLGRAEAGHIVLVSGGEIYSLATNQEYKRAFQGEMGIVAGAPLGGLVERDPGDKYGLARELIHPLLPWLRKSRFQGPIQVTAVRSGGRWRVIEYNVRIGVTSGAMILRLLENPAETLLKTARGEKVQPRFRAGLKFGCSLTLAAYGYPFTQIQGPELPISVRGKFDCDVWWNFIAPGRRGQYLAAGHRVADVVAVDASLPKAVARAYNNIRRIRLLGAYYRTDIGRTLWPPGSE